MHLRNNRGLRHQLPNVEEFARQAREHFMGPYNGLTCAHKDLAPNHIQFFVQGLALDKEFYETAWHGGDPYMVALANVLADVKTRLAGNRSVEEAFITRYVAAQQGKHGDVSVSLTEFISMLEFSDWNHRECDDAKVFAAGQVVAGVVDAILTSNPAWKPFYDFKLQEVETMRQRIKGS